MNAYLLIRIIAMLVTGVLSYNILGKIRLTKTEKLWISAFLGFFVGNLFYYVPLIISGEYQYLELNIVLIISVASMSIIWYKKGKKVGNGFALGILIYLVFFIFLSPWIDGFLTKYK